MYVCFDSDFNLFSKTCVPNVGLEKFFELNRKNYCKLFVAKIQKNIYSQHMVPIPTVMDKQWNIKSDGHLSKRGCNSSVKAEQEICMQMLVFFFFFYKIQVPMF